MISIYGEAHDNAKAINETEELDLARLMAKLEREYHGKCGYCEKKCADPDLRALEESRHRICAKCLRALNDQALYRVRDTDAPRDLLDPQKDTPENHLNFLPDGLIIPTTAAGRNTIESFGLNRPELVTERKAKIDYFTQLLFNRFKAFTQLSPDAMITREDGKVLHERLFEDFFRQLAQSGSPSEAFSLLGQVMMHDFHHFFIRHFPETMELDKVMDEHFGKQPTTARKEWREYFLDLLFDAYHQYHRSADFIFVDNGEEELPYIPNPLGGRDKDKNKPKGLFMALKGFEIQNHRRIRRAFIRRLPINTRWIFITGGNGAGKTLLLQALVYGMLEKPPHRDTPARQNLRVMLELWHNEHNYISIAGSPFHKPFYEFAAYGSTRSHPLNVEGHSVGGLVPSAKPEVTDNLFSSAASFCNIETYLLKLQANEKTLNKYNLIKNTLECFLPDGIRIIVDESVKPKEIMYLEERTHGGAFPALRFENLSIGTRGIYAMVGDMIIRLMEKQKVDDPAMLRGIVFIDDLDIHLPPVRQRQVVERLTRLFPHIQFIASIHGPVPLLSAPPETVLLKVEKNGPAGGIEISRLQINLAHFSPQNILNAPGFNFQ